MSTGQPGQVTQQASGMTAADKVAEFFKMIAAKRFQPRLRYVSGVCRFDIDGAGSWRVAVNEGNVTVSETSKEDPSPVDVVVTTSADVMERLFAREGNINILTAAMQELMTVRGDPAIAYAVIGGATLDQAEAGGSIFDQAASGSR